VRAALGRHMGERPSVPEGELLATLGIDLDEVRAAVRGRSVPRPSRGSGGCISRGSRGAAPTGGA